MHVLQGEQQFWRGEQHKTEKWIVIFRYKLSYYKISTLNSFVALIAEFNNTLNYILQ